MAFSNQSTKMRLLKLLQHAQSTQPNSPVSLSELAQTLNVSRERVRQLYRQLAVEFVLPPVKKRKPGIGEIMQYKSYNQADSTVTKLNRPGNMVRKLRAPSPQTLALEAEVQRYIKQDMSVPEIARKIGRPAPTIYTVLHRLHIPFNRAKDTGRRLRNPETLALEAEVRKYSEQGLTAPDIAGKIRRPRTTIYSVLSRLGIPFKRVKDTELRNPKTLAFDAEVKWYYFSLGMSSKDIASITGRNMKTVYAALHRLGVPLSKQSHKSG
jgi:transposase